MADQPGFLDISDRLRDLSAKGDDLDRVVALVEFSRQAFRLSPSRHPVNRFEAAPKCPSPYEFYISS